MCLFRQWIFLFWALCLWIYELKCCPSTFIAVHVNCSLCSRVQKKKNENVMWVAISIASQNNLICISCLVFAFFAFPSLRCTWIFISNQTTLMSVIPNKFKRKHLLLLLHILLEQSGLLSFSECIIVFQMSFFFEEIKRTIAKSMTARTFRCHAISIHPFTKECKNSSSGISLNQTSPGCV